ncbi:MAG: hypothetical protein C4527_04815 [Candidatus Omnitrophota bacterium]|nr:MAG: hypothetical protein C4527_04815 [Candidatus Omnitrophota bacterium]
MFAGNDRLSHHYPLFVNESIIRANDKLFHPFQRKRRPRERLLRVLKSRPRKRRVEMDQGINLTTDRTCE